MPKKPKAIPDDCMPKCETCTGGEFQRDSEVGECRLFPMDWVVVSDQPILMWKGCYRDGWCRHYERKAH